MILAAPLIPPFAQAVGITAGSLGLIGLTKKVNDYIRANPKESMEILKTISPGTAGIISLFENKKRGIGDNNPPSPIEKEKPPKKEPPEGPNLGTEIGDILATEAVKKLADRKKERSLTSQNFLDDNLMNDLLLMRGGIEGYKKNMGGEFPKMPGATKSKMEIQLQKKLFDKYKINEYPEGESPETVNEFRKKYLKDTYFKNLDAIDYITSVAYDVIGRADEEAMLVVDEDGLPIAGAKVESKFDGPKTYSKDALTITEMGSIFKDAGDQLFNDIIKRAKDEGKKYIVAEDLTSEGALQALKNRGFRTPTTKDTKRFKGTKIRRPDGRTAYQKNLVLELDTPEKKALGGLIDKPLLGRSRDI
jgi:hypothetical protein